MIIASFLSRINMDALIEPDHVNSFISKYNSIIHFNARSLRKHFDEIHDLLSSYSNSFSLIAITETWLSVADKNLYCFPNSNSEYCNKITSSHGGVAIFISPDLSYKRRHDLHLPVTNCESVWIEITNCSPSCDQRDFIFGCIYRSPSSSVEDFFLILKMSYISFLLRIKLPF